MSWAAGDTLPTLVIDPVRADLMDTMATILDDPNEIHLDPALVRRLGFGDQVINQGPSNCGYVMNMLRSAMPTGRLTSFSARFLGNVFAGDRLTAGGVVLDTRTTQPDGATEVECEVWLENGEQRRVLEARARMSLPANWAAT